MRLISFTQKIAEKCVNIYKNYVKIFEDDLIIEPSAGNGVFISHIKKLVKNYKFFDIEPENDAIIKQDFLLLDNKSFDNSRIHIKFNHINIFVPKNGLYIS